MLLRDTATAIFMGTAWLLGGCGAAPPRALQTVSVDDIENYKYAMDMGCSDEGARKGKPAALVQQQCACAVDYLTQELSTEEWQQIVLASRVRGVAQEVALTKPYQAGVERCLNAPYPISVAAAPLSSITGTWTWTRPDTLCQESYEFLPGGLTTIVSGQERVRGRYEVTSVPENPARAKLSIQVEVDHGGTDCAGSSADSTGQTNDSYLLVHRRAGSMMICSSPLGRSCFGPLLRSST